MAARGWGWRAGLVGLVVGVALGVGGEVGGALLLFTDAGLLSSVGFVLAIVLVSAAAGVWAGPPARGGRAGRWMVLILAYVIASFFASAWARLEWLQETVWGRPLAVLLMLAEPAYATASLLVAVRPRSAGVGTGSSGVLIGALAGAAGGVVLASTYLIPNLPPGPILVGGALLLAMVGSLDLLADLLGEERDRMNDRVVVITGVGGRGQLGYALAEAFLARGARLVVTGRSERVAEHAASLGSGNRVVPVVADLATVAGAGSVASTALDRFGRLDVLVNVAGGLSVIKPLAATEAEEWTRELSSNARTAFLMSRAALPALRERGGVIVNFASPAGERAVKNMGAYSAGKAAVVALTRALALEEQANGVRVNAVAPGMVDTAQNRESVDDPESVDWVTREEIAAVVLFLVSDAASGVTGQTLHVPGRGLR